MDREDVHTLARNSFFLGYLIGLRDLRECDSSFSMDEFLIKRWNLNTKLSPLKAVEELFKKVIEMHMAQLENSEVLEEVKQLLEE